MYGTTLTSWPLMMVKALEAKGIDARALLRQTGLDPDLLDDPNARYHYRRINRFYHRAVEVSGDPCIGLEAARYWHPTTLHALGYAWLASQTLQEAFDRLARYARIVSDTGRIRFERIEDGYRLVFGPFISQIEGIVHPTSIDMVLAVLIRMCRTSYGDDFQAREVHVSHPRTECQEALAEYHRAPLVYGAERDMLIFDAEPVEARLPTGNAELARVNEEVINRYIARMDQADIVTRVKVAITESLPSGRISEERIADRLNMSQRSLQRRLQERHTCYRDLLEETRRDLANRYMEDTRYRISEITYLLGFSDPSNFTRAFRRWKGVSPTVYRRAIQGEQRAGAAQ